MTDSGKYNRPRFLYYIPYLYFQKIHLKRPIVEIPLVLAEMGYEPTILMGKNSVQGPIGCNVIETGVTSRNEDDRGLKGAFKETCKAYKAFRKVSPKYALFHGNYSPSTLVAILVKLSSLLKKRKERPKISLKLDWDGDLKFFPLFGRISYLSFVFLSALVFDRLTIETDCAFEKIINYPFIRQKLTMVPNTVSRDYFPVKPYSNGKRKKLIVTTSVIDEFKGIEDSIRGFFEAGVADMGWKFDIIGPVRNVEYFHRLQQLILSLGLVNAVSFLGEKESTFIKEYYNEASIYMSMSRRESFGIARLEAIACGIPVLSSHAGCGTRLSGAVAVEGQDSTKVSIELSKLVLHEELRMELVRMGQKKLYTWKEISSNYIDYKAHYI